MKSSDPAPGPADPRSRRNYRICVLHQGFIPLYRERFYTRLNAEGANAYVVFHGPAPSGTGHVAAPGPFTFPNVFRRSHELRVGSQTFIYQPVLRAILDGEFDAAVIGHEYKLLTNLLLLAAFKWARKPVLLWGHGYHRQSAHWLARAMSALGARLADGYLVYTAGGAERLQHAGVSGDAIFVVNNTLDLDEQIAAHDCHRHDDVARLRSELGLRPEAQTLLYIGRLYARKRCADLIELVRRLNGDPAVGPVDLAIVGDGPDRAALEAAAEGLPNIRFFGAIHDADHIARLMRVAVAMVNPGSTGLAVNHCFAHGVPILTRDDALHSPEFEYVRHGANGLVASGGEDAYIADVRRVLCDEALRARLAAGALETRTLLGLDRMVTGFCRGVEQTIDRKRRVVMSADTIADHRTDLSVSGHR